MALRLTSLMRWLSGLLTGLISISSSGAQAHVKWFAEYDVSKPPNPIGEVLNGQFAYFFLASVLLVYTFFLVDRYAFRKRFLEDVLRRFTVTEPRAFDIMRGATFVFFAAVGTYGIMVQPFFLTPELKTDIAWVPWVQIGLATCSLNRRTVPLVGAGIVAFFILAAKHYAIFHLIDYMILLGLAYYFLVARMSASGWVTSRYIVLYASTALTLLWAAIEKWGYPIWTYPLLARDTDLLMGMEPSTYMVLAGFVEFGVAFVMLSSTSLLSRFTAFGLGSIFLLAIYKFGLIDAIGHLMIIAILGVLVIYGPTKGRNFLALNSKSIWTEAYFMTGLYSLAFVAVFIAYYGLHALGLARAAGAGA